MGWFEGFVALKLHLLVMIDCSSFACLLMDCCELLLM
jgi:hypothetical protein